MNLYPVVAYLRHLLTARSTAGHGVHSPYIYDFLTKVVRNRTDVKIVSQVESLRRAMLSDKRSIMVTDLGAGSVTRAGGERRVAGDSQDGGAAGEGGRTACEDGGCFDRAVSSSAWDTGSAFQDTGSASRGTGIILELGTSLGISTLALALAAPERRVITVEGCPALAAIARENLQRYGAANAEVMTMEFSAALESLREGRAERLFRIHRRQSQRRGTD